MNFFMKMLGCAGRSMDVVNDMSFSELGTVFALV
jgi:hypothetical protein